MIGHHQILGFYIFTKDKYNRTWYYQEGRETWVLSLPTYFADEPDEKSVHPFDPAWADEYENWHTNIHQGQCSPKCACVTNRHRF